MTTVVIAEKPSMARAIREGLGPQANRYEITNAFGHILEQAEPDAYLPGDVPKTAKGKKIWRMQDLPIRPTEWKKFPKRDAKDQLATIGALLNRPPSPSAANRGRRRADRISTSAGKGSLGPHAPQQHIGHWPLSPPVCRWRGTAYVPDSNSFGYGGTFLVITSSSIHGIQSRVSTRLWLPQSLSKPRNPW